MTKILLIARRTAILLTFKIEAAGGQRAGGAMVVVFVVFFGCVVLCCVCGTTIGFW